VCSKEARDGQVRSKTYKCSVAPKAQILLLAQEDGAQSVRIQRLTNGYDKNVFGMLFVVRKTGII